MGLSSAGIGSGLDIESLISKLMSVESAPLANFDKKTNAYQTKLDALTRLGASVGAFQSSLTQLSLAQTFRMISATAADKNILSASATSDAAPGTYKVNVTQLAQAQSLNTAGQASMSTLIGGGASTTLTFQFGSVSGQFGIKGSNLSAATASGGIANGSLSINGTAITTSSATNSAKLLADAVNAQSATTGVTATAATTATGAALFAAFGTVATTAPTDTYALSVNGVQLAQASNGGSVSAASIDSALASDPATASALAAANITFTGTAVGGNLQFFAADGSNLTVTETTSGTVTGGIGKSPGVANTGSSVTTTSGVTLASSTASPITVGGNAPVAAGLAAGTGGSYLGGGFSQDGAQGSGTVVLNSADQSLQGIRDAINKANIGVSASIVSDGSASPYRLVLTSDKTGASSTMKISLSGTGGGAADPALVNLLAYDPAGTQNLSQTSAAQSAKLSVNGIAVSSNSSSVSGAIQGVTLDVAQLGSTSVTVARDSSAVKDNVNAFVKAYNDLNNTIKSMTSYNADTKQAGVLLGDSTVRSIQAQLRSELGTAVTGTSGQLTTLGAVGISFAKDGSLSVDSTKLQKAIDNNFSDIGSLFAAIGTASDSLVAYTSSTAATKPGVYAVNVSHMATQGSLTGTVALTAPTVIAANTVWNVTLNQTDPITSSKVQAISIPAGSYDNNQLTAMLRAAINGNTAFAAAGDTVDTAIDASGHLSISSHRYGAASNIDISTVSGSAASGLFGTATPAAGTDIAGTIGGEAATGSGQTLTGGNGSPAEGLKLEITGGASGDRGTISFSHGYAYQLNNLAAGFLGKDGLISNVTDGINVSIKSVAKSRDAFSASLADIEKRYRAQFTALDVAIASMQSTQSYLTQQLAALAKNS